MLRRIILVLSAIAAVLLGLEKVGVFQFAPAGDVGFGATTETLPDGRTALALHTDVGDLPCWLQVVVRFNGPNAGTFEASIDSGEPLVVDVQNIGAGQRMLSISKSPIAVQRGPFVWRAGLPVRIASSEPTSGPLLLEDWAVYAVAQPSDSESKARWRTVWTWASWFLLVLAILGAAVTAWPQPEPALATSAALVRAIVASVDGDNPKHTERLRSFLRKALLESVPVREALDALKIPSEPFWTRPQFVARARRVFLDRITAVKAELDAFGDRLA